MLRLAVSTRVRFVPMFAWWAAIAIALSPAARSDAAVITVDAAVSGRVVDMRHFGLNAAVWDSSFAQAADASLLRELGCLALRFPGGSLSDEYHWAINRSGSNTFTWATSFTAFAGIATNIGAQVIITVNYGTGTPEEAAAWVRHSNVTNHYGFHYWEIGNECYGTWETDTNLFAHDAFTYATRAAAYFTQMKAADPTIQIGVPVDPSETSYANGYTDHTVTNPRTGAPRNGWTPVMLVTLQSLGVIPDFLVYHRYAQGPGAESDAGLLQSNGSWRNDAAILRQILSDYLGAGGPDVELVCTENNSVYANPGKQTTSLVNGLFLADSIATALQTEFKGVIWWDLRNSKEAGNNNSAALYGWRQYGDYGIASGYERYPASYVFKLLQYFARGGDTVVPATSDDNLLSAYAVRRASGALALLVINKDPLDPHTGIFTLRNFTPRGDLVIRSYGVAQDEAARTGVGSPDLSGNARVGTGPTFSQSFPPYSVSVLSLAPSTATNIAPTVTLTSPVNNQLLFADQIRLAAAAVDPDGLVTNVEFIVNGETIGQATQEPYALTWSSVVPGSYTLTARATDPFGLSTTSTAVRITVAPPPVTLIATGSVWRYLDSGANLGTAWRGAGFVDTAWPAGPAQLGFGDGDEATVIASNRQWTTYFRRAFDLPGELIITNLILRLLRDDGAVVYVNSNEVWRSNMPATGAIAYNTPALAAVPAADETTNFYTTNITAAVLRPGSNLVAVEVHQSAITSSDLSFDFALLALTTEPPRLTAALVSGPTGTHVRLAWPAALAGFVLQHAADPMSGWSDLSGGGRVGSEQVVYDLPTQETQFYRLRRP